MIKKEELNKVTIQNVSYSAELKELLEVYQKLLLVLMDFMKEHWILMK